MDAIDKYLQQKRYSQGKIHSCSSATLRSVKSTHRLLPFECRFHPLFSSGKTYEKKEKPTKKAVQGNASKISSGLYLPSVRNTEGDRKSVRTPKVPGENKKLRPLGECERTNEPVFIHEFQNKRLNRGMYRGSWGRRNQRTTTQVNELR